MGASSRPPSPVPVARRVFHLVAASTTTLLSFALPEHAYLLLVGSGALLGLVVDSSRPRFNRINRLFVSVLQPILKPTESSEITGATWFLVAAFFAFFFYGPAIAVPVLMFVAVGDPAAALIGSRTPGPRWWNKSPAGPAAFVAASLGVWAFLAAVGLGSWSWAVVIAAVTAALVEFAPFPTDDNLSVPLIAGAVMTVAQSAGV